MDFIHFAGEIMGILSPEIQAQILTLHYSDKRSIKSIAREFGVDPKTVRRVVRRREVHLGIRTSKRKSILDPFKPELVEFLKREPRISNTSLLNHLRSRGYTGGASTIKDFMKEARGRFVHPREAFLRLEFAPGEVAQVDWGEFGDVFVTGSRCIVLRWCSHIPG
jgi:transposase